MTPRFQATLHGQVIGWYDTQAEAQAALDAAMELERREEADLERELYGDAGCPGAEHKAGARQMPYTIDSAKAALAAGDASIESIAAETGWPVIDDCLVPEAETWHADDGNAEITEEHDSAQEAAQSYVDGGDWGEITETSWVRVYVWREAIDSDGDRVRVNEETIKITLEPDAPECTDGTPDHDWQAPHSIVGGIEENPGVWANGGGLKMQEVCLRCGCGKLTNTWAQDPQDGQQGLRSVSYQPAKYTAELEKLHAAEVNEFVASYSDYDEIPEEELERVFRLAYGRDADDEDRETGLWSLICTAAEVE